MASSAFFIFRKRSRFRNGLSLAGAVMWVAVGQGRGSPARSRRQGELLTGEFSKRILDRAAAFQHIVLAMPGIERKKHLKTRYNISKRRWSCDGEG
jgi:hypothetical protein